MWFLWPPRSCTIPRKASPRSPPLLCCSDMWPSCWLSLAPVWNNPNILGLLTSLSLARASTLWHTCLFLASQLRLCKASPTITQATQKRGKSDDRPHLFFIPSVANVLLHEFILHAFSISSNLLLLKERMHEHKKLRHDGSCGFLCHFHPFSGSGPRLFAGHLLEAIARANYVHSDWLHNVWTVFARCLL